ncbi:glycoside hydrolase family 43 protein [Jonesia quinghaiensis]|uniref:glycoside hydrolase family 43 protein n=1 Tax=Jonesia quinghaiensis TaxID=262806 RepID=UPI0004099EF6|nr:glycoside hydrolase family 43 protein [Jonesia quinghaiensis]
MTAQLRNPVLSGFNPDPSIVRVGDDYYLATSTFEYLPGLPIYHSTDLVEWNLIGHVAVTPDHLAVHDVPTGGGAWAPTLRYHNQQFWLAVTDAMGRGTLIFTAGHPSGPWSAGTPVPGVNGIDPDLAWDSDGTCYMTYSALRLTGDGVGSHDGIEQVRINPTTGETLCDPYPVWSGTGLMFPEAPHLYQHEGWWYLLIAEGGTERGHSVSISRGTSPAGPFEGAPTNPILSARSTARPVQNTGHGDLVLGPDGQWLFYLLGMRTHGGTRSFSPRGRETFVTTARWVDGWLEVDPVELTDPQSGAFSDDFMSPTFPLQWLGLRALPADLAHRSAGHLTLRGDGAGMSDAHATFVGIRLMHLDTHTSVEVDTSAGIGGLSMRYDEAHHYSVEARGNQVIARACVATLSQEWSIERPAGTTRVWMTTRAVTPGFAAMSCDEVILGVDGPHGPIELAVVDGRFLSAESTCSFTGRVIGVYCESGEVSFQNFSYTGSGN